MNVMQSTGAINHIFGTYPIDISKADHNRGPRWRGRRVERKYMFGQNSGSQIAPRMRSNHTGKGAYGFRHTRIAIPTCKCRFRVSRSSVESRQLTFNPLPIMMVPILNNAVGFYVSLIKPTVLVWAYNRQI